jgi:capsular polysaccharide transport system permease protein
MDVERVASVRQRGEDLVEVAERQNTRPAGEANLPARRGPTLPQRKPGPKPPANRKHGPKKNGPAKPHPDVIEILPLAEPAQMRRRHWALVLSFILFVLAPLGAVGWYLSERSADQFASTTGFSVRREEAAMAADMFGGLAQLAGGGAGGGEADILYEFIQSQDLVTRIDTRIDLRGHYTAPNGTDPVFTLAPGGTAEDVHDFWQRMVQLAYDQSTGLMTLRVLAFSPDMAKRISEEILDESRALVNDLNATARADALRYAEEDLNEALLRLKDARAALVAFRTRTQIVDPATDLQGRMGVLNSLQQQLAQVLIEHDLLAETTTDQDARLKRTERQIAVIRARIDDERRSVTETGTSGQAGYPALMAEYENLTVDLEFAEQSYRTALAALDGAIASSTRDSLYLATYIRPTLAEKSEYPRRLAIFGLAALFLGLGWAILSLIAYSLRDRS